MACGYRPALGGPEPSQKLSVDAAPTRVAEVDALRAVMAGARAELSRMNALAGQSGFPCMTIELLRVDEKPAGITLAPTTDTVLAPLARGSAVAVVGRAWVSDSPGSEPSRDTGNMRRAERYASTADPRREASRYDDAIRSAADELGHALARRVLGLPEPAVEPM